MESLAHQVRNEVEPEKKPETLSAVLESDRKIRRDMDRRCGESKRHCYWAESQHRHKGRGRGRNEKGP